MGDWAAATPTSATGFDENICKSLLEELETCINLFTKFYQQVGTREDTRDLRAKINSTRTNASDASARLKSQLGQPVKQAYVSAMKKTINF